MSTLTLQNTAPGSGLALSGAVAATSTGDTFPCGTDERNFLYVKNGGGSAVTITIAPNARTSAKVPGAGTLSIPTESISVAASAEVLIGPFPAAYADGAGNVDISYSSVTSVTVMALRCAPQSF